ncbi:hypothetical protein [Cohnella laeviribosi]|uniref:hypothetical protein n=1 Tax=Cohnella laeviribosi TaxID=380174 RepID=UPI00037FDC0B|nr:hypothetical protein [Cohnella laeviribosi]
MNENKLKRNLDIDGSHANGLPYVPYNGYIAELHRGERVLTAAENRDYNRLLRGSSGFGGGSPIKVNITYSPVVQGNTRADVMNDLKRDRLELRQMVAEVIRDVMYQQRRISFVK